jgi:hypothetical protein
MSAPDGMPLAPGQSPPGAVELGGTVVEPAAVDGGAGDGAVVVAPASVVTAVVSGATVVAPEMVCVLLQPASRSTTRNAPVRVIPSSCHLSTIRSRLTRPRRT